MDRHRRALPFTPWHRLEVRNAIRMAVWHKLIALQEAKTQLGQLDSDLREETLLVHTPIDWTDVLREAEQLSASFSFSMGRRSADLFHIAACLELGCDTLLTFDERQSLMARAAGLNVKP